MRNVEAKFRLADPARVSERALAIGFTRQAELTQHDTFFVTKAGKLKLREEQGGAHLIFYRRHEIDALQLSNYEIVAIAEPARTRAILAETFGVLAEVRKHRTLLIRDNVRLHLDRVEGLGSFGEIEAVLTEGEEEGANRGRVAWLLEELGIAEGELIGGSYFELMGRA